MSGGDAGPSLEEAVLADATCPCAENVKWEIADSVRVTSAELCL